MPTDRPPLTQERLKELLHYDPETGHFTWRVASRAGPAGTPAGSRHCRGYIEVGVDGASYLAHRLAFLYMTGGAPKSCLDHADRDRTNNSWGNLREASYAENAWNSKLRPTNTSGFRGVTWDKCKQKWMAQSKLRRRHVFLGYFDVLEEAAAVAEAWRKEHHGEFYSCLSPQETLETPEP